MGSGTERGWGRWWWGPESHPGGPWAAALRNGVASKAIPREEESSGGVQGGRWRGVLRWKENLGVQGQEGAVGRRRRGARKAGGSRAQEDETPVA